MEQNINLILPCELDLKEKPRIIIIMKHFTMICKFLLYFQQAPYFATVTKRENNY